MAKIERVEIYFEPMGFVKRAMGMGSQVAIPLHQGIPAAIRTADQILGLGGTLITFACDRTHDVHVTDEKSDAEWASFVGAKCSENTQWKRWNGETTQGRWNVVVYLSSGMSRPTATDDSKDPSILCPDCGTSMPYTRAACPKCKRRMINISGNSKTNLTGQMLANQSSPLAHERESDRNTPAVRPNKPLNDRKKWWQFWK